MHPFKELLLGPFGPIFSFFLKALIGSLCFCGGAQLFNFKNLSNFFTLRKIIGIFLLGIGINGLLRTILHLVRC